MDIDLINWDDLEWADVEPGLRRKTYHGDGITVTLHESMPGTEMPPPHSHVHEQIAYYLSGNSDFMVDGVVYKMKAGSIMAIPPNVPHCGHATGTEPAVNLDIFVPQRPEHKASERKKK